MAGSSWEGSEVGRVVGRDGWPEERAWSFEPQPSPRSLNAYI
jgi:hypothetical protein